MSTYDWLSDIPESLQSSDLVEVQFKNTRKGYYLNTERIDLYKGDIVAVESTTGHDIGEVTLTGKLAELAMKNHRYRPDKGEFLHIYRVARPGDLERWEEAKRREEPTMIQARQIASSLGLDMKIGDVEYQGDGNKAIFYYIADERVDFRQLIKVSGIGAKTALGILSAMSADELAQAVAEEDVKRLSSAPGIGKKTAERIPNLAGRGHTKGNNLVVSKANEDRIR